MTDLMSLAVYHAALRANTHYRRFNERWIADPEFRRALFADVPGTLSRYDLAVSADDVGALLDPARSVSAPSSRAMWQMVTAKSHWVKQFYLKDALPADPRMLAWRERQIARYVDRVNQTLYATLRYPERTPSAFVHAFTVLMNDVERRLGSARDDHHRARAGKETVRSP